MTDIPYMRPLIGVTTSEVRRGDLATLRRHGEPPQHEMALGLTYMRAVELAGGVPVVLPPLEPGAMATLLTRLDGVCLSGGPDLDPAGYGARAHAALGPTEPALDRFELELACAADALGMPLLGVCRGAQALNIARGGTLHQHIDGHRQSELATLPTHSVRIAARSPRRPAARRARGRGQLLPPPGRRHARRRPRGHRVGARRHDRGHRGPAAPVPARRAVARRDADRRPGPARAVRRARRGRHRAQRAAAARSSAGTLAA